MDIDSLIKASPIVADLMAAKEVFWLNPDYGDSANLPVSQADIFDAAARFDRFASYFVAEFPETAPSHGILESPLTPIPKMKITLTQLENYSLPGNVYLKEDNKLPISGSIKSRGGIYEVLKFAEKVAIEAGMLTYLDDYSILREDRFKELFSHYGISVGSTGNLALSIGIVATRLGFKVKVHMSSDAKTWKKDLLRAKGVKVIEYDGSFTAAITAGRKEAEKDPNMYFIDDEGSYDLFLGYSVAAIRLQKQLKDQNIKVDAHHPLFVYLPAGVGGSPSGVTFGLKEILGPNVHAIFAEPTHISSVLLGMATGLNDKISVYDIGLDGKTEADGLAVGRPSRIAGKLMKTLLLGIGTFDDERVLAYTAALWDSEKIKVEPSATAGFAALRQAQGYLSEHYPMESANHIIWSTGGMLVPDSEYQTIYQLGKKII
ncbi:D-serine ammonia-lyase [Xylocopilactobacillus apicola]|uniref:Probable D-serine dehydratase n=1 Tax=Xylocopilactobacillus apicola TaxID=2932184 RepID=A0AAU9DAK4_9LACO|nr:D-serine ammonia-lyase [Xylocopilactobacillus apicola]BDR58570.1 putative D-serine dehydratase [Xylocopilactobacillus apicola]